VSSTGILAPVNRADEVTPLLKAGSSWLYGGCVPSSWQEKYPETVLLNQRTFSSAQFRTQDQFQEAVKRTRDAGCDFALTLNAPFYMDEQIPVLMDLVGMAREAGVSALIMADPGLIRHLGDSLHGLEIHLSTMGLASNPASVKFFTSLGVSRIILPRYMTISDIGELVAATPGVEYEAFTLIGKCPNIEGVCSFLHDDPDRRWPCEWRYSFPDEDIGASEPVIHYMDDLGRSDRRHGCGICALPLLVKAGVNMFKIVGRGAPLERKVEYVGTVKKILDDLPEALESEWVSQCMDSYQELFGHKCTAHNCYYPEVRDGL